MIKKLVCLILFFLLGLKPVVHAKSYKVMRRDVHTPVHYVGGGITASVAVVSAAVALYLIKKRLSKKVPFRVYFDLDGIMSVDGSNEKIPWSDFKYEIYQYPLINIGEMLAGEVKKFFFYGHKDRYKGRPQTAVQVIWPPKGFNILHTKGFSHSFPSPIELEDLVVLVEAFRTRDKKEIEDLVREYEGNKNIIVTPSSVTINYHKPKLSTIAISAVWAVGAAYATKMFYDNPSRVEQKIRFPAPVSNYPSRRIPAYSLAGKLISIEIYADDKWLPTLGKKINTRFFKTVKRVDDPSYGRMLVLIYTDSDEPGAPLEHHVIPEQYYPADAEMTFDELEERLVGLLPELPEEEFSGSRPNPVEQTVERGEDLYQILGVARTASDSLIRKAYFKKVRQFHPDKTGRSSTAANFIKVQEAYEILSDEDKRAQYDARIAQGS